MPEMGIVPSRIHKLYHVKVRFLLTTFGLKSPKNTHLEKDKVESISYSMTTDKLKRNQRFKCIKEKQMQP